MTLLVRLLFVICLLLSASNLVASDQMQEMTNNRKTFLLAEQYLEENRTADFMPLAESIKNYPLYPYLQYQWLKKRLNDNNAIINFIKNYSQNRFAQLLRLKWLANLGKTQQWQTFISFYRNNDDIELQCYLAQAHYYTGHTQLAIESAKQFWLSGKTQSVACNPLFQILKNSVFFNENLIWDRFKNALKLNNLLLASELVALMSDQDKENAELWIQLHRHPSLLNEALPWKKNYAKAAELFAHGISRLIQTDVLNALDLWDTEAKNYNLNPEIIKDIQKNIGLELAFKRDSRAYERLSEIPVQDNSTKEWRIRAALNQQNWQQVDAAINSFNEDEKLQDKWQYWLARSLTARGDQENAQIIYAKLAKKRSLYGFLAAERINQNIEINNHPVQIPETEIDTLANQNQFLIISEFLALDRNAEAKKEWWFALSGMDQHNLKVAAKLAQRWHLPSLAIFTIAKANEWDDLELRFPLLYQDKIQENAKKLQIPSALLLGLIRQESAFDNLAESPVGAKGLMQLMPKTAQQIAQELQDAWTEDSGLINIEYNLKYGSFYYKKLLSQFNGDYMLAIAAYNAGPNKVKRWIQTKESIPGDIWLETIPYKETRNYVTAVLLYSVIYQHLLNENAISIQDLVKEIKPG